MGLRVRIKLKAENKVIESSALLNSGFEAEDPEIVLPPSLAEVLGVSHPMKSHRIMLLEEAQYLR